MNQLSITQQLSSIWEILKHQFEYGASLEEISAVMPISLEKRTLQRRLDLLKEQGAIKVVGKTKSTRYVATAVHYRPAPKLAEPHTARVELSGPASLTLHSVSQPIEQRYPVSSNNFFLEAYRPNIDHYLTEEERKQLHTLGKTKFRGFSPGTYAKGVLQQLIVDMACHSSRLDGGHYGMPQTEALVQRGELFEHAGEMDHQMVLNHQDAVEFLAENIEEIGLDNYSVRNLHGLLTNNMLLDPAAAGQLRQLPMELDGSVYRPLSNPRHIQDRFMLLLEKANQISDPFEQAIFLMVQIPYLQPFAEMNTAVSRMVANIPLMRNNLMPLVFNELTTELYDKALLGIYELNRVELMKDVFISTYRSSAERYATVRHSFGEPDPFRIRYREQIRATISGVVTGNMIHQDAEAFIRDKARNFPAMDQLEFIELVESELAGLHDGNIARYWIKPSEFMVWKATWDRSNRVVEQDNRVVHMTIHHLEREAG